MSSWKVRLKKYDNLTYFSYWVKNFVRIFVHVMTRFCKWRFYILAGLGLGLAQEKGYAMRILGIVILLLVILTIRCW